jgi:hypothetical protein
MNLKSLFAQISYCPKAISEIILENLFCKNFSKTFLILIASFFILCNGYATTYYSRASGGVLTLTNWNTLSSGTGGTSPINFTSGDIFIIQSGNSMTTPSAWTVSGVGSGLQIQTGGMLTISNAVSVVDFTLAGGTLTTNSAFSVAGNWTNNGGTFNNNANTVTFNGTNQEVTGTTNTTFGSVTISSGCTLLGTKFLLCQQAFKLQGTGYFIQVLGTSFPANGTKTIDPTTTYEYRGAAASSWPGISGISFGNLIINATGTVSCGTNLTTIKGNLVVKSNLNLVQGASTTAITGNLEVDMGTLDFNTLSGVATINVAGNVILNGGILNAQPSTSPPSFNVKGNWTTNTGATFTPGTTTVTFNGSTAQTIDGTAATNFYSLALSTSNGTASLNLSNNITIANLLTLNSREIITGSNMVTIGGLGVAISRSSGWINGSLAKTTNSGSSANYTYAIGDASNYTPVTLTFTNNATTAGTITVYTTGNEHPQISTSGINSSSDVNRYWTIANNGLTFSGSYGAILTFVTSDIDAGANTSTFITRQYNGSNWSTTTTGTRTSTTTQATGMTSFGDFAVGGLCMNISGFNLVSVTTGCTSYGPQSVVSINSPSLPDGNYVLTYNLSGANISTGNTMPLTLTSGSGTYNISNYPLPGSSIMTITGISNTTGCTIPINSGNTFTFTVDPQPTISSISQGSAVCEGSGATITLAGLLHNTTFSFGYNINAGIQTSETGIVSDDNGTATFTTNNLSANNNGQTLGLTFITATSGNGCTLPFINPVATLSVNALPIITLGDIAPICAGSTTFNIPYTATTANFYSVSGTGITAVANGALASSSIAVSLTGGATSGTIPFSLIINNSTTGCISSTYNGSVTVNSLPTLTSATQTGVAGIGTGATISLAGLLSNSTFSLNYTINGIAQTTITGIVSDNTGAASFTSSSLSAGNNGQVLQITSIIASSGCAQSFTQNITLVVVSSTITWTGAADVGWSNAANWSSGIVPTASNDIIIPAGLSNYPNLNTGSIASAKTLTIQSGATVTVSNASELDVYGIVKIPKQGGLRVIGTGSKVSIIKTN